MYGKGWVCVCLASVMTTTRSVWVAGPLNQLPAKQLLHSAMKWLGKQLRERHTTLNQWCSSYTLTQTHAHTTTNPKENVDTIPTCITPLRCTQNTQYVRSLWGVKTKTKKPQSKMKLSSSGIFFPLIYFHPLLLPPFTLNGDSGDRWREVLTLLPPPAPPHPPLLSISPLPWCLFLNYISTLASTATLFTHCSIHIHLACTCLVPVRVTWRERTLKTYTCTTHTHTHTGSHTYAQALPWDREGVNERWRCQRGREKMKISGRKKGERVKKNREIKWGKKGFAFPFCWHLTV